MDFCKNCQIQSVWASKYSNLPLNNNFCLRICRCKNLFSFRECWVKGCFCTAYKSSMHHISKCVFHISVKS